MKSPFPGMDPFLEGPEWQDFHTTFNTVIREVLLPELSSDYHMRVERRVYLERVGPDPETFLVPDVAILSVDAGPASGEFAAHSSAVTAIACTLPQPERRHEAYLVIRERSTQEVVTVIETLSPSNKRGGGDGRREYLAKRDEILSSTSHLVELDLLRGGERLPVVEPLPVADYFCIVSRHHRRPRAELYAWSIQQPLPTVMVPLKRGDSDVPLALQLVFDTVYSRAGYDRMIDYMRQPTPGFSQQQLQWVRQQIAERTG